VTDGVVDDGDVQGFDPAAARAIALADAEARQLGHDRVGTEHLLLGLLTNSSSASQTLSDAGVTVAAARSKVVEAVGALPAATAASQTAPLPRTARAVRALARSVRFAHARGSELATSHHLLLGVLDVEGIAGQVLRGLGLDVESLRVALDAQAEASDGGPMERPPDAPVSAVATCPECHAPLDHDLEYRVVVARGDDGRTRDAVVFVCGVCGQLLGVGPA
jgi:ATP-dependent Clp protease ATP-binding subunit ClpC